MNRIRSITVSVDYADCLAVTLPYNQYQFEERWIVTTPEDYKTIRIAEEFDCKLYTTNSFYDDGADFNKFKALEEGLEVMGREGWICIMDADILWPILHPPIELVIGCLYGTNRHMYPHIKSIPEHMWSHFPLHGYKDFSGFTQLFHADDMKLKETPWHELDWKHAGGGDTHFADRWPKTQRVKLPFNVLHLGEADSNWCGRGKKEEMKKYGPIKGNWRERKVHRI